MLILISKQIGFVLLMVIMGIAGPMALARGYLLAWDVRKEYWLVIPYIVDVSLGFMALSGVMWILRGFLFGRGRPWLAWISTGCWVAWFGLVSLGFTADRKALLAPVFAVGQSSLDEHIENLGQAPLSEAELSALTGDERQEACKSIFLENTSSSYQVSRSGISVDVKVPKGHDFSANVFAGALCSDDMKAYWGLNTIAVPATAKRPACKVTYDPNWLAGIEENVQMTERRPIGGRIEIQEGGRRIVVVGHRHGDLKEKDLAYSIAAKAINSTNRAEEEINCSNIENIMAESTQGMQESYSSSQKIYSELKSLHEAGFFKDEFFFATESVPDKDFPKQQRKIFREHSAIQTHLATCPKIIPQAERVVTFMNGAAETFYWRELNSDPSSKGSTNGIDPEDQRKIFSDSNREYNRIFDILDESKATTDNEYVVDAVRELLEPNRLKRNCELFVGDREIKKIASKIPDAASRAQFLELMKQYNLGSESCEKRDRFMAEKLLTSNGNVFFAVGTLHIPGLARKFERYCAGSSSR